MILMKKHNSRRQFIAKTTLAAIAVPLISTGLVSCKENSETTKTKNEAKKLKILILGGTSYLGPHQVAYAISQGHQVSIFTRGKTIPSINTDAFKKVEHLIGDRENNLTALENRKWDVVIDNSGRKVEWTKATANLLKDNVGQYIYISSTGVYYPYLTAIDDSKEPVLEIPENATELERYEYDYGVMKAKSELAAIDIFGKDNVTVIRPTYMLGPGDKTDRFIHWPLRLQQGGNVLVPGKKDDLVQHIDIRDVAEWSIKLAENKTSGTFNAVGPKSQQTILDYVIEASKAFDNKSTFTLVDDYDFLEKNDMYFQIPWLMADKDHYGSARIDNQKAIANGLTYRPTKLTVKDVYNWWNSDAVDNARREKYNSSTTNLIAKEKAILEEWSKKQKTKS